MQRKFSGHQHAEIIPSPVPILYWRAVEVKGAEVVCVEVSACLKAPRGKISVEAVVQHTLKSVFLCVCLRLTDFHCIFLFIRSGGLG